MSQAEFNQDDSFLHSPRNMALVALGSNLPCDGNIPLVTLTTALRRIDDATTRLRAVSRFYATPCFPAGTGPDYVNAAAFLDTLLPASALLARLHELEDDFGRQRVQRWGMRTLDLDLLAYGDMVLPDRETYLAWRDLSSEAQQIRAPSEMIIPHPRLQDRGFVLVPLADIAPDWCHPVLGRTVTQMLGALDPADLAQIRPLDDAGSGLSRLSSPPGATK